MSFIARTSLLALLVMALASCSVLPAPSISSVESVTVASSDVASLDADQPTVLTLHGSDFGERQGLNRLFYAGFEVPSDVVTAWSDETIELSYLHPAELLGAATIGVKSADVLATASVRGGYVPPDEQRFEVRTFAGSAWSDPVRLVLVNLWVGGASGAGDTPSIEADAYDLFGLPWPDLELALTANRGTLTDAALVTDVDGRASTTLTTVSALPHAVVASVEGRAVAQDATLAYSGDPSGAHVPPDEATTLDVRLSDRALSPAPAADLDFSWKLTALSGPSDGFYDLGVHATDTSGTASVPLPALTAGFDHRLVAIQNGFIVSDGVWVYPGVVPLD